MPNDENIKNVSSTGSWKEGSDGSKYRTGGDGKDGSYKVERLTPTPDGSHAHEISKASTAGGSKSIHTANKGKR
ncbi:MAG TPA: hypothetical protein VFC44_06560 [Candidatus Saccharimonadales bacterium]|nr:hypothetical protein [Candidatus Saccharimonadales bacterium]